MWNALKNMDFKRLLLLLVDFLKPVVDAVLLGKFVLMVRDNKSYQAIALFALSEEAFKHVGMDFFGDSWSSRLLFLSVSVLMNVMLVGYPLILIAAAPLTLVCVTCQIISWMWGNEEQPNNILSGLMFGVAELVVLIPYFAKAGITLSFFDILLRIGLIVMHMIKASMTPIAAIMSHIEWNRSIYSGDGYSFLSLFRCFLQLPSFISGTKDAILQLWEDILSFCRYLAGLATSIRESCDLSGCVRGLWRAIIAAILSTWRRLRGVQPTPQEQAVSPTASRGAGSDV